MSLGARRALALVLVLVGGLGLCCGLFPGVLLPLIFTSEAARIERLEPLSFAAVEDGVPGREALIEGVLSNRNRASPEGFVAYNRSVPGVDSNGNQIWREVEQARPPLLIELPGGLVQVRGAYLLNGTLAQVEQPTLRIAGLRAGDSVMVVGRLVQGAEAIELEADTVAPGTRAAYLRSNREALIFFRIFGYSLLGVGGLLFIGGLLLLLRSLTESRPPANPYQP